MDEKEKAQIMQKFMRETKCWARVKNRKVRNYKTAVILTVIMDEKIAKEEVEKYRKWRNLINNQKQRRKKNGNRKTKRNENYDG